MKSNEQRVRVPHCPLPLKPLRPLPQVVVPLPAVVVMVVVPQAHPVDAVAVAVVAPLPRVDAAVVAAAVIPKSEPQFVAKVGTRKNLRESRR